MAERNNYNQGWIGRVGADAGEGIGCLDLWVGKDGLVTRTLPDGKEVGEINMNGRFAGPSGVKHALGDGILGDDGVLFVRVSFWEYNLERLKKLNPTKGMRIRVYGKFHVENFTRQDGTAGQSVRVNATNFDVSYFPNRDANGAVSQSSGSTPTEPEVPTTADGKQVDVPF